MTSTRGSNTTFLGVNYGSVWMVQKYHKSWGGKGEKRFTLKQVKVKKDNTNKYWSNGLEKEEINEKHESLGVLKEKPKNKAHAKEQEKEEQGNKEPQ